MGQNGDVILEVKNLKMHFPLRSGSIFRRSKGVIQAVDGLSFSVRRGETLGLVGESGCGKSTTGLAILQLYKPTAGQVLFEGTDLSRLGGGSMRKMRRRMQMIFQDPYESLNPRLTVGDIIGEPLEIHGIVKGKERRDRVQELMRIVGLNPHFVNGFPQEFSGGHRQKIGIARALAVEPSFIICDEPISGLDGSIQAQIIDLLEDLHGRLNLTYLFIAQDLNSVRHITNRIAVMYAGKILELADRNDLYQCPQHPYTKSLLSVVPKSDALAAEARERIIVSGAAASLLNPGAGCRFKSRCTIAGEKCGTDEPQLRLASDSHWVACHSL